ncbi:phage integrase family protein [Salinisphaera dokdonensis CL-ES53]|uniref:Phage integrase family protein n=1 Tax=Salinisphaera dokdonensis CL-ES53 TaxID=1304272 RepID=A0ABV2B0F8_9GAMM
MTAIAAIDQALWGFLEDVADAAAHERFLMLLEEHWPAGLSGQAEEFTRAQRVALEQAVCVDETVLNLEDTAAWLARGIERGNARDRWRIRIPAIPHTLVYRDGRISPAEYQAQVQIDGLIVDFEKFLPRMDASRRNALETTIAMGFCLFDCGWDARVLDAFLAIGPEGVRHIEGRVFLELAVSRGSLGRHWTQHLRIEPTPPFVLLCAAWRQRGFQHFGRGLDAATCLERFRKLAAREGFSNSVPATPGEFFAGLRIWARLRVPPYIVSAMTGEIGYQTMYSQAYRRAVTGRPLESKAGLKPSKQSDGSDATGRIAGGARSFLAGESCNSDAVVRLIRLREALDDSRGPVSARDARRAIRAIDPALAAGPRSSDTIEKALWRWVDGRLSEDRAPQPGTLRGYVNAFAPALIHEFGHHRVDELTRDDWRDVCETVLAVHAPAPDQASALSSRQLHAFHKFLRRVYKVPRIALESLELFSFARSNLVNRNIVPPVEFERLIERMLGSQRWQCPDQLQIQRALIAALAFHVGLRGGEAAHLVLGQLRGRVAPRLEIRKNSYSTPKTSAGWRPLDLSPALPPDTLVALVSHCDWRRARGAGADDPVFVHPDGDPNQPLSEHHAIRRTIRDLRQVTNDPTLGMHHLRHGFANYWALCAHANRDGFDRWLPSAYRTDETARSLAIRIAYLDPAGEGECRSMLYTLARQMGHLSPRTTLGTYIHTVEWTARHFRSGLAQPVTNETVRRLLVRGDIPRIASALRRGDTARLARGFPEDKRYTGSA